MEKFFDKLSEYEIWNNFFPGIVFCYLLKRFTPFTFSSGNEFVNLFVYYFVGMILGRIGSILLEPILCREIKKEDFENMVAGQEIANKKFNPFILKAPGNYYYEAEHFDKSITTLSSKANIYRSLAALFMCFIGLKIYSIVCFEGFRGSNQILLMVGSFVLAVLFLFAFRKQTVYIVKGCITAIQRQRKELGKATSGIDLRGRL